MELTKREREDIKEILKRLKERNVNFKDKGVLITGGAGFLGSFLADVLVEQGANVIVVDNLASGKLENIEHLLERDNFRFKEHNIALPLYVDEPLDYVFHFASRASPLEFDKFPIEILKANTIGTWISLGIAREHHARYVFASTSEVYGDADEIPTPETYKGKVNTLGIRGAYDESKRVGEAFTMAYMRQHNLDVRIVRIFNTYGPRIREDGIYGRVISRFIEQALKGEEITIFGDGKQTRSFTYVVDEIEGILLLAYKEGLKGEVMNIGNTDEISILELANTIKKITGSSSPLAFYPLPHKDDPRRRCPDISKARKLIGWEARIKLEEGIKRMIEWKKERSSTTIQ